MTDQEKIDRDTDDEPGEGTGWAAVIFLTVVFWGFVGALAVLLRPSITRKTRSTFAAHSTPCFRHTLRTQRQRFR